MTASTTHREPTRDAHSAIITAAERLFADQGIEGVSLREIMRAAGQRNTTSLQYHFGDRDGLLRALVEKHIQSISVRRDAILDLLASHKETSLRDACSALVQPLVAKLNDPDGGREFLQIAAQLVNRDNRVIDPEEPAGAIIYDHSGSQDRWNHLVEHLMPPGTTGSPLHRRFAAIRFVHIEIGRRARSSPDGDHALFSSQLVDLSAALLRAEISEETQRLLDERPRRKSN
ncbi:helix-turn-helix transcriptional regulator (plasmid) [Rhodococcus erythropolis]|uniref:TetR/AcrR family transcriptional regulator n=1 Tax=Rhodococcus baikonurensis TaxID=172041 RepID=A0ABV5XM65_9NOCA|nr:MULTISPECIES: TetR family transcriptional regulator [Rhodococcus]MCJ0949908.1 TetR/AcrR family transcriptional regulator [Rhodococcus sp. ARC_M8]MCQ4152096.1 TetR/AcrR family transcriptional regulator [Rhodococcus qingshengii]MDJ0441222.1 helix-turn-helix domain-containing protein [Rhodococcus qingshengii]QEX08432.1 helix-turn-helix transcriptional regulator [Rhodococcus erythropolis]